MSELPASNWACNSKARWVRVLGVVIPKRKSVDCVKESCPISISNFYRCLFPVASLLSYFLPTPMLLLSPLITLSHWKLRPPLLFDFSQIRRLLTPLLTPPLPLILTLLPLLVVVVVGHWILSLILKSLREWDRAQCFRTTWKKKSLTRIALSHSDENS